MSLAVRGHLCGLQTLVLNAIKNIKRAIIIIESFSAQIRAECRSMRPTSFFLNGITISNSYIALGAMQINMQRIFVREFAVLRMCEKA
jgi:hypothetical protein